MKKIRIDGNDYEMDSLNEEARKLAVNLGFIEDQIKEVSNLIAILTKAKRAYIADLKTEMLSAKTGFDFGDE